MDIKDIIIDQNQQTINLVQKELEQIDSQNLHNEANYKKLLSQLNNFSNFYDAFHVITEDDKLIGFSGLHSNRWGNVGRILQCTYKTIDTRRNGISYAFSNKSNNAISIKMALLQINIAKQKGLEAVFVSLEYPRRYVTLNNFTKLINKKSKYKFALQPYMYLTCPQIARNHWSCWQNITLCKLNFNYKFDFEYITHKQWKKNYHI